MSEEAQPDDVPVFVENFTSAAIDGARISVGTAGLLVSMDSAIPEANRLVIMDALDEAGNWLNAARAGLPAATTTSVHIVRPNEGRLIVP